MASEGGIPRKAVSKAQGAARLQWSQLTKAPKYIPDEAVKEYMELLDGLVGLHHSATEEPGEEREEDRKESQQEEDADFLSYIDKLCSQEDFETKVEEAINSRYLAQLLFPEEQLDFLAVAKELLEHEERLTLVQMLEKLLLTSKEEEGVQAILSHVAPRSDSMPSESVASQDAQRCDYGPQLGVKDKACPPETDFKDCQRHGHSDSHLSRPKAFAVSSGRQECPPLEAECPSSAPQGPRRTYSGLGPRDASIPRQTHLGRETGGPGDKSSENEGDLPRLAFPWASPNSLWPGALSLSPVSASGLSCPGGQRPLGAAQPQPQRRKCDQSVTRSRRRRHCPYSGAAGSPSRCQFLKGPDSM